MSRLINSKLSLHNHQTFICSYCFHGCYTQDILDRYVERCKLHGAHSVKLPDNNNKQGRDKVKFTKTEFQLRLPFVIYAYFESILLLLLNKVGHGLHRRQDQREERDPPERVQTTPARTEQVELHYVYAEHGQRMQSIKHNNFNVILIVLLIIFHLRMRSIWKEYHIL